MNPILCVCVCPRPWWAELSWSLHCFTWILFRLFAGAVIITSWKCCETNALLSKYQLTFFFNLIAALSNKATSFRDLNTLDNILSMESFRKCSIVKTTVLISVKTPAWSAGSGKTTKITTHPVYRLIVHFVQISPTTGMHCWLASKTVWQKSDSQVVSSRPCKNFVWNRTSCQGGMQTVEFECCGFRGSFLSWNF